MKQPILTVIIPCYNQGIYLSDALSGVSDQEGIEVIIVNDGSTDPETIEIFKQLDRSKYVIIEQENKGLSPSRNIAIQHAKAPYILALDADNRVLPEYYRKAIQLLNTEPETGVVYCNPIHFGKKTEQIQLEEFNITRLLYCNYIDACAIFRKEAWEQAGKYDENLSGHEDWELWISIHKKGWKFHFLNEFLFHYRVRENSMVTNNNLPENKKKIVNYVSHKHWELYQQHYYDIFNYTFQKLDQLQGMQEYQAALTKKIYNLEKELVALQVKAESMRLKNRVRRLFGLS